MSLDVNVDVGVDVRVVVASVRELDSLIVRDQHVEGS